MFGGDAVSHKKRNNDTNWQWMLVANIFKKPQWCEVLVGLLQNESHAPCISLSCTPITDGIQCSVFTSFYVVITSLI